MTPAARVQAAIELLDAVIAAAQAKGAPADRLIADYFRQRRYAGSKDRRAVRELVYRAIRVCGPVPPSGRAAMIALGAEDEAILLLFDGSPHGPAPLADGEVGAEPGLASRWLVEALASSGIEEDETAALLDRAPLDLRINTLKAGRESIDLPEHGEPLAAPNALRFPVGTSVDQWPAYREGLVEIQDHGSQLACMAVEAQPGETVIDLCAGAGGKTLALAAAMQNRGTLIASDTDRARLANLAPRAERAGAGMIETLLLNPGREMEALERFTGAADAVLVDAPCSGTGTWRRNPEARWRLDRAQLARFAETQDRLLGLAAQLVRPGGRIVYVTCSLLDVEGADRIAHFLAENPEWRADRPDLPLGRKRGSGIRLTPFHDQTDGFFIARAALPC